MEGKILHIYRIKIKTNLTQSQVNLPPGFFQIPGQNILITDIKAAFRFFPILGWLDRLEVYGGGLKRYLQ